MWYRPEQPDVFVTVYYGLQTESLDFLFTEDGFLITG